MTPRALLTAAAVVIDRLRARAAAIGGCSARRYFELRFARHADRDWLIPLCTRKATHRERATDVDGGEILVDGWGQRAE